MSQAEALTHLRAGRPQAAAAILEAQLKQNEADAQSWFLLGACRHALNDLPAAAAAFSRSLALEPGNLEAQLAHIAVIRAAGNPQVALDATTRALARFPGNARLLYATALNLEDLDRTGDALAHYDRALALAPEFEDALHNRGLLLSRLGKFEDAEVNQRRYVAAHPGAARAHSGLADILLALGRPAESLEVLETVKRLSPGDIGTDLRRGVALSSLRRFDEARLVFDNARAADPVAVAGYLQRIAPGSEAALMLSPENLFFGHCNRASQRCDWTSWNDFVFEMKRLSGTPDSVVEPAVAFMALHLPLTAGERHAVARRAAAIAEANAAALPAPSARLHSRIRIGVLSPDLREHIVAHLLLPLFELLDRKRFELYAYSLVADGISEIRNKLCAAADRFRDLHGVSDKEAADQIRRDGIDILIDASGHTTGTRFGIAARRPAHVQAQYLGYAGSLGSTRIDYVIVDPIVDTSPAEWSEVPIRLPHTYYLYDFRITPPNVNVSRRDYGLPEGAFVYCAFHKPEKISPDVFLLWMRVLQKVDGSVLWLMALPATAQQNLRRAASARGVDPVRLIFAPFEPRHDPRYLARHRLGDLMLDAPHYNAIATACDALAVALPVLTLRGTSMASRSGESLLRAAGLPELVAPDQDAYVEQAVQLASDPERLAGYRRTLAARRGPLFDTAGRVREIEQAFLQMWRQYE